MGKVRKQVFKLAENPSINFTMQHTMNIHMATSPTNLPKKNLKKIKD